MSDGTFNIAKGRVVEFYNRVKSNDPAASTLVVTILQATGLESDATLQDYDTLSAILAAANDEPTNTGFSRKVLTDADLAALPAPDDTNNRYDIDLPDITWTAVAAGSAWSKAIVCYDPSSAGATTSGMIPLTHHDFAITPDGSDIILQIAAAGFFRAA